LLVLKGGGGNPKNTLKNGWQNKCRISQGISFDANFPKKLTLLVKHINVATTITGIPTGVISGIPHQISFIYFTAPNRGWGSKASSAKRVFSNISFQLTHQAVELA
jgi:hypothetical protein